MCKSKRPGYLSVWLALVIALSLGLSFYRPTLAAEDSQYFPDTGKTVSGKFLQYWRDKGGLPTFGFPITDAQIETDPETGKAFLTQWFERNRFELHPENAGTKYEVLLGLLGKDLRREALAPGVDYDFEGAYLNLPGKEGARYFTVTSHYVLPRFLKYWDENGGLERFGYPMSEEHDEVDPETGKAYSTQWFERARFEYHPENAGTKYEVLLGLLGNQIKSPKSKVDYIFKKFVGSRATGGPLGLAIDKADNIYVSDPYYNSIVKYSSKGVKANEFGTGFTYSLQFKQPTGIALDSQGNLYVIDKGNHQIQKISSSGKFLTKWGTAETFTNPYGIALDSQDNVYVTDFDRNLVQKFDSNGQFLTKWGGSGGLDGLFARPVGITVDKQGIVYVCDSENSRIQKFDQNGKFLGKWGGTTATRDPIEPFFEQPFAITIDRQGNFYIAEGFSGLIRRVDPNGKLLISWGSLGEADAQFKQIIGIVQDSQNRLYVADSVTNRVQKFRLNYN